MKLVKIGVMAMRSPSGEFLEAEPIYRDAATAKKTKKRKYLPEDTVRDLFADKIARFYKAKKEAELDERLKKFKRENPDIFINI